jgi:hypothetical protein
MYVNFVTAWAAYDWLFTAFPFSSAFGQSLALQLAAK